ncbi:pentatricopeptide repeat-containing protein At2g15820, chloroplastic [Impatiens glandulifera]|uniref:pentatricopeptide repeat-containing protein At2g15820, chloroplastic n=1 Tax=Impatiens glandulifera TaxID=253017 RepID=UPI001FB0B56D|nr:pentatricopeptide repeat-containing protein At2g15820, chloroplastic [Impatiens glandulifera]
MPMVKTVVVELSLFPLIDSVFHYTNPRSSVTVHRPLPRRALSLRHENRRLSTFAQTFSVSSASDTLVQQFAGETESNVHYDGSEYSEIDIFKFDDTFGSIDMKPLNSPVLEVKELDELPEQWRRSKLAWLCKELPSHKGTTLTRILNAQRKWVRQEDATYLAFHCLRIRENETSFRVYKWMMEQHWFRFDFALATKLADYMGKERKSTKCREIFDDIINQGRVPNESTFHILIVAYLSSQDKSYIQEACKTYKRMIQLGGYKPRLSLHNSLFRSLVSKTGSSCKNYLKEAEFIYHNLTSSGLQIHRDIYSGLIWIHSYQDSIDKERIASLRAEMKREGYQESQEIRLSILRVCAKEGNVDEAERIYDSSLPSKAIVYKIEAYANAGQPLKSLEIFKGTTKKTVSAYHKIIEILCRVNEVELAESLMEEFAESGLKPLMPSFIDLMNMFLKLDLYDKLELAFLWSVEKCSPNRTIYNIYLNSLVRIGNVRKAEDIFSQMVNTAGVGVNNRSCNFLLGCYLTSGEHVKAEQMYVLMCQMKYDAEPSYKEKIEYNRSLDRKEIVEKTPLKPKLTVEQREILIGMLLGGLRMEFNEDRKDHSVIFEFNENQVSHMKERIHDEFREWLAPANRLLNGEGTSNSFRTISHVAFSFYAEQFWPNGRPGIPKLIHRWLSPRVLAFWYMYGGYKTSSGDLLLKLKGGGREEDVERVVKGLKARSLVCKGKKKGRVYWIGFLGENAKRLWETIEPYVLDGKSSIINFDSLSEMNGSFSDYSDHDDS